MDIFNIIIMWAFGLQSVHSLVMTQYPTDTLTKYLLHVSKASPRLEEEALDIFRNINIRIFCSESRQMYVYRSGPNAADYWRPNPERDIYKPKYDASMDVEQSGIQLRKFKIENLNQTLSLHSFQCSNNDGKPIWFVATAFVPHSAFLFEVEPKFRHLIARETKGNNGIPAKLLGLIDEGFMKREWSEDEDASIYRYLRSKNFTGKETICDFHPILHFRLCALGMPHWYFLDRPFNTYDPNDGGCKAITIKEVAVEFDMSKSLETQEMFHCPLRIPRAGLNSYYVGLVSENPFDMIVIETYCDNETLVENYYDIHYRKFAILNYLDTYQSLLKNLDVNL